MAWITFASVSVTNGAVTATVNSSEDISLLEMNAGLIIGELAPVAIKKAYLGAGDSKVIELFAPWPHATQTNKAARVFNTDAGLPEATAALNAATELVKGDFPEVVVVADNIDKVVNVSDNIDKVVNVSDNIDKVVNVSDNIDKVVNVSDNMSAVIAAPAEAAKAKTEADKAAASASSIAPAVLDGTRRAVEYVSGGRNTVIYDAQGNPNVMVVIPRFTYESLGLTDFQLGTGTPTAFLTNGVPRGEILIAKYLASAGGATCSVVGGVQPMVSVNYDQAKSRCVNKGAGWHLMSVHEWAAIALWSVANGTVPRGNTNHGRAHDRLLETARCADNGIPGDSAGTGRTDTGKGPATWTHDHTVHGIHDLVGNVWEWQDQMLLAEGQIKASLDNDPSLAESAWPSHAAFYDSTSSTGGAPRLNDKIVNRLGTVGDSANAGNSASVDFRLLTKEAAYVPSELMRRLLLEAPTPNAPQGRLYMRNFGQRLPIRGGYWYSGASAGLGALGLNTSRSNSSSNLGFRPAYFA